MMVSRPMCLITIYPNGWVEARATDDVRVKIHSVPILQGDGTEEDARRGITPEALKAAYRSLPLPWRQLVDETWDGGVQTGYPDTLPEEDRYDRAEKWAVLELFAAAVEADDELRLPDLYHVEVGDD